MPLLHSSAGLFDNTAGTIAAFRILETASPPTFYLAVADVNLARLVRVAGNSTCERMKLSAR